MKMRILCWMLAVMFLTGGCASSRKRIVWNDPNDVRAKAAKQRGRSIASVADQDGGSAFDQALKDLEVGAFSSNLHAHHFMSYVPPKKKRAEGEKLKDGPCEVEGNYPEDDGRPCRAHPENGRNWTIEARNRLDYFNQSCAYAREQGELDVLFITPHGKDGSIQPDASTLPASYEARHRLLKPINDAYNGKFYCGLGQESSSISAGNHINIFGQFRQSDTSAQPFLFDNGAFNDFYPQVKARMAAGEPIVVAFNHPGVRDDLWWGNLSGIPKKELKEKLNDYGIDDYAPVGCLKNPDLAGCTGDEPKELTLDSLKKTYANIREASGDPFRMIEVIGTAVLSANPDKKGHKSRKTGQMLPPTDGATDNPSTEFKSVNLRMAASGLPGPGMQELNEGLYDYVYYLAMGFRIGPAGNQDNHHMNFGSATSARTGILSSSLEESDILNALKLRRVYASEDKNAKMALYGEQYALDGSIYNFLMGSEIQMISDTVPLMVGYQDADEKDHQANVRFYYYRENDALDFNYRATPENVFRLVSFKDGKPILPTGPSKGYSMTPTDQDSIPIRNGEVIRVELPTEPGLQYVFVEITQNQDGDKIYSAPLWIRR